MEYSPADDDTITHKIEIKEFFLDIGNKNQYITENHTFQEFWNSVKEVEDLLRNNTHITVNEL